MYDTLLVLHLLAAAAIFSTVVVFSAFALGAPADPRLRAVGSVLWAIGGLGTIVLGVWLAIYVKGYDLLDGWILGSIVLWAIATELGRRSEVGFAGANDARAVAQASLLHWLRSAAVLALLAMMIFKPGA